MKKFLLSVACLCLLAVLVPAAKLNAATLPWDDSTEVKGEVRIGSTVTVEPDTYNQYYKINVVAGQSYYLYTKPGEYLDFRWSQGENDYSRGRNFYATKSETYYIRVENDYNTPSSFSVLAGQQFTGTVTKADARGDNIYYYTPVLSGQYTFEVTSSDPEADPYLNIGMMKGTHYSYLKAKDSQTTFTFGKESVTANLQAGRCYAISVYDDSDEYYYDEYYYDEYYYPYTLALTQTPSVSVDKVVVKKAVSTKAKKATVTWKKVSGANGYQVTYSLKKNFKKAKSVTVAATKAKVTLKKLKKGKTYYVKVRAFKVVEGNKYYGAYSKKLKVKVK